MEHPFFVGRGFGWESYPQIGSNSRIVITPGGYNQVVVGGPVFTFGPGNSPTVIMQSIQNDTSSTSMIANWGGLMVAKIVAAPDTSGEAHGRPGIVTGNLISQLEVDMVGNQPGITSAAPQIGQNTSMIQFGPGCLGVNMQCTPIGSYNFDVNGNSYFNGGIVDSTIAPSTIPICPNGTNGAFTTSGCTGGGGGINPPVGDIGGTTGSPTVIGLEGITLPTLGGSTGIFYDLAGVLSLTTSASVLTTGTLPHAQLPALVSGDIPNNAANTSGNAATATTATALAGTPTLCTTGQAPTGILSSGNATGCASISSGLTTQTNGTNNISQSTLNLINSAAFNGLTFTFTNTGTGTVQAGFSGTLGNAGLTNPSTTINGVTATLGSTASLPFSVIGSNDTLQVGINFIASTVNALGLVVTPSNPSSNNVKFELLNHRSTPATDNPRAAGCTQHQEKFAVARTIVGVIDDTGRLPGWIAFDSP